MAAPTFISAATGFVTTGGNFNHQGDTGTAGDLVIVHVLQDGSTANEVTASSGGTLHIENLAGTDNAWTTIGTFAVGSPTTALHHLFIGRRIDTSAPVFGNGSARVTSEDWYIRMYTFRDVNTGTTLADVIENGTAGTTVNGVGLSATAADAGVTTLGADRLALNFVAVNDDNACAAFTGQSGGTWAEAVAEFADATGTDGAIQLQIATIASAGTINGGTGSITDSDSWGVVGFALIPVPPTSTSVGEVSLAGGTDPGVDTDHSIIVRARVTSGAGTAVLKAALYEGSNNRSGDLTSSALTASLANYELAIPAASAANITDYSNLGIRFWGYNPGGSALTFEVDYIALRTPGIGGTTGTFALTTGTVS